jgi:hypothetical protein
MNTLTQDGFLERLFVRSCMESSPRPIELRCSVSFRRMYSTPKGFWQLYQLKEKLLHAALEDIAEPVLSKKLCGAAQQAAKLAWSTPFPALIFPCLFQELAQAACEQFRLEQASQAHAQPAPQGPRELPVEISSPSRPCPIQIKKLPAHCQAVS